mgnify:CR=1 FL=1
MKLLIWVLELFPALEVLIRVLYWRIKLVNQFINYVMSKSGKKSSSTIESKPVTMKFDELVNVLQSLEVIKGDTLIVHSSFAALKPFGLTPDEFIDSLLEYLGPTGNLILPAIPILRNQPSLLNRFNLNNYNKTPVYNVQKSRCWTGSLAQCLLKREGAKRSRSPLNSMVVYGNNVNDIVRNDLFNLDSLPCDAESVLGMSLNFNSKILFLGVDEVHNMTMIHAAEDLDVTNWPIKNWYWKRPFHIIDEGYDEIVTLRERNPMWALFYAEKRFSRDLLLSGIFKRQQLNNLSVSVCVSNELLSYLNSRNNTGYPYWIPRWFKG